MTRTMLITAFAFATTMLAASSLDFSAAAAESAKKAATDAGGQYGVEFVHTASQSVANAMSGCDSGDFAISSTCDLVFIISAAGQIERVLQGRPSPFAQCIVSHLQMPKTVAKPPSAHWPLHVRIIHGHPKEPMNPLIMFFADNSNKENSAYYRYNMRVHKLLQDDLMPAFHAPHHLEVDYEFYLDRQGHVTSMKVHAKAGGEWAEQIMARSIRRLKSPPIPPQVFKELEEKPPLKIFGTMSWDPQ